jgi:hypothetical protein
MQQGQSAEDGQNMDGADAADLFSGFTEPLVPFPYLVALILLALPLPRQGRIAGPPSSRARN